MPAQPRPAQPSPATPPHARPDRRAALPGPVALGMAGCVATVAFDLWGQAVAPALGLGNLAPVPLARGTLIALLGWDSEPAAQFMHLFLVGLVAYPLGWVLVRHALQRAAPGLGWLPASALYGVLLWVFAIGLVASAVTGHPFLNFTRIAWIALVGHVIYAVACGWALRRLEARRV